MNLITAQEAHQLSTEKYKELLEVKINHQLDDIYRVVRIAVKEGLFDVSSPLKFWGKEFEETLSQILLSQGYTIEYINSTLGRYIKVKWEILK